MVNVYENIIEFTPKIIFVQDWNIKKGAINLFSQTEKNIPTSKDDFIISYPGEYEKDNIYIIAIEGAWNRLNYFVYDYNSWDSFAFLQEPSILENLNITKLPSKWYFRTDNISDYLDKYGFEWERIKL